VARSNLGWAGATAILLIMDAAISAGGAEAVPGAAAKPTPPEAVDLRPAFRRWGLETRVQGKRGTCSAFVVTEATATACSWWAFATIRRSPAAACFTCSTPPTAAATACFPRLAAIRQVPAQAARRPQSPPHVRPCRVHGRKQGPRPRRRDVDDVATEAEITSRTPATTLLASVEPCSEPDIAPPRDMFGHHAACQRGAMFKTSRRPDRGVQHLEHRSTLTSSVVAKQRVSWGIHLWS